MPTPLGAKDGGGLEVVPEEVDEVGPRVQLVVPRGHPAPPPQHPVLLVQAAGVSPGLAVRVCVRILQYKLSLSLRKDPAVQIEYFFQLENEIS
jgi:hypothetical protein